MVLIRYPLLSYAFVSTHGMLGQDTSAKSLYPRSIMSKSKPFRYSPILQLLHKCYISTLKRHFWYLLAWTSKIHVDVLDIKFKGHTIGISHVLLWLNTINLGIRTHTDKRTQEVDYQLNHRGRSFCFQGQTCGFVRVFAIFMPTVCSFERCYSKYFGLFVNCDNNNYYYYLYPVSIVLLVEC